MINETHYGDVRDTLRRLRDDGVRVQTAITSPPYYGLRDYGVDGQLGLEPTPEEFLANMVEVFRLVRDILHDDGTIWVNMGDSFAGSGVNDGTVNAGISKAAQRGEPVKRPKPSGIKQKDLMGIPWALAFALRADGWYLRSDIIWAKGISFCPTYSGSVMPESVTDRPTKGHEYLFLLSKNRKYFYDADAVGEPQAEPDRHGPSGRGMVFCDGIDNSRSRTAKAQIREYNPAGRNLRSVWAINTEAFKGAHFATFPRALVRPCILAGSRVGDTVLDPFMGSGTTAQVAEELGRNWIGRELNPDYAGLQAERLKQPNMLAQMKGGTT